ncbi:MULTISPECIES: hypothetical protein [Roseomonadaceae]|uniref:Uncharacterized protein n=1 Tax=Falsiroseomonas oleicola TaxID=2801474 RepID=A0ABS6HBJ0_9PROT|nr:hypothetical protein [Roseomonas oleicola]MBU8546091.1 hypothetical protein [Roseomonas oleicola]
MREALEQLLFQRYPALYVGRHLPLTESSMARGFTHGDGWFAIVDVLSKLSRQDVQRTGRYHIATQVKQKFAALRFHMKDLDDYIHSARVMGERYSLCVSELSGRPGALHVCDGHYYTLALGERSEYDLAEGTETPLPRAGQPDALDHLSAEYGAQVPGGIDVPTGWVDLVHVFVLQNLVGARGRDDQEEMAELISITATADGELTILWNGEPTPDQQGFAAFAQAMVRHIDPVSGAIGPVDDKGIPAWKRAG